MPSTITLDVVSGKPILKYLWGKHLRKLKRATRLAEFELAHDPLEFLWFDWALDVRLDSLVAQIRNGSYRPSPPEFLRQGKSLGLSRPLAYPAVTDHLIYKSLVSHAANDLLRAAKPWSSFGRADAEPSDLEDDVIDSGWFRAWLRRQAQLWIMTEHHAYLAETDIANFFPYVQVAHVLDHVATTSRLDGDCLNLLRHILSSFAPRHLYRPTLALGLPQENFDCSRVLAHSYLFALDNQFASEGEANAYSRWMDDIVIGAHSVADARMKLHRVQMVLESLGLYPNTAKTRIYETASFTTDYMKTANDFISEISADADPLTGTLITEVAPRLHDAIAHHLAIEPKPRAWTRVLQRYFTLLRKSEDNYLLSSSPSLLRANPELAPAIFEYLRNYQLSRSTFEELQDVIDGLGDIYDDTALLFHEFLATVPNDNSGLVADVAARALADVKAHAATHPRLASAACLTLAKHGVHEQLAEIRGLFESLSDNDSPFVRQAAVCLLSIGLISIDELASKPASAGGDAHTTVSLLRELIAGEHRAVNLVLEMLQPTLRGVPPRRVVRPRSLLLLPLVESSASERVRSLRTIWSRDLDKNPPELHDASTRRWLGI